MNKIKKGEEKNPFAHETHKTAPTHPYVNLLVCIHNNSIITNQEFFIVNKDFMYYMLSSLDTHLLFI